MIILTEKTYKPLGQVPHVEHPDEIPDVIFFPVIFNHHTVNSMIDILNSIVYIDNKILFADNASLVYKQLKPHPFPFHIENLRDDVEKIAGRSFNTCLIRKYDGYDTTLHNLDKKLIGYDFIIPSISFGATRTIQFVSKYDADMKEIKMESGTLLIERELVDKYWSSELVPTYKSDTLYFMSFYYMDIKSSKKQILPKDLPVVYRTRYEFTKKIKNGLSGIRVVSEGERCFIKDGVNELSKYIKLIKLIGIGDWGNVYSACLTADKMCVSKFAIKMSRITDDDYKDPYTETSAAWYEIWMLKDILKPLVKQNLCPNLPLFIETFLCSKCDFIFLKGVETHPCVITAMELASGDMRDYMKFSIATDKELYSALFQIMAGLHAIQMAGQILNNDIKSKNILYYNVKPGGYWHYIIDKQDFYVPNYGKLFVLNDFGVSTLYDPNFQLYPNKKRKTFNLGSRYAINMNEIFSPVEAGVEYTDNKLNKTKSVRWVSSGGTVQHTSKGATYRIDRKTGQVLMSRTVLTPIQKSFLFKKGITTNPKTWSYFEHPNIIPPFEFYNDVQDTLRTFVGGKRTTQKGSHTVPPHISKTFQKTLKPYLGLAENVKDRQFSLRTYHVLAGSFIKKFFTKTVNYKVKLSGKQIGSYNMDKCSQINRV